MRVFLTGGTGLVGSHVAEALAARGDTAVCLHRPGADTRHLEELGCSLVKGDIRDLPESLAPLVSGCRAVVHTAAVVDADGSWPRIRAVNVEGTRSVMEAAGLEGVERAVALSSITVYGTLHAEEPVAERDCFDRPLPPSDLYARSKREAEEAARAVARRTRVGLTLLRAGGIYGERDRLLSPWVASLRSLPVVPVFGPGDNALPVVYAGNVAGAVLAALDRGSGIHAYDLAEDHPVTQEAFLRGLLEGMGATPRFLHIPAPLVRAAGWFGGMLDLSAPGAPHLRLARAAPLVLASNPYPSRRIREALGWQPAVRLREALERTGAWFGDRSSPAAGPTAGRGGSAGAAVGAGPTPRSGAEEGSGGAQHD